MLVILQVCDNLTSILLTRDVFAPLRINQLSSKGDLYHCLLLGKSIIGIMEAESHAYFYCKHRDKGTTRLL